jgi:hypothetical protein
VFGNRFPSRDVVIRGNRCSKGYDGKYGTKGGVRRGWAHCLILSGAIEGAQVIGNTFEDVGSSHPEDQAPPGSLALVELGTVESPVGHPKDVVFRKNILRNARDGFRSDAGALENVTFEQNTIRGVTHSFRLYGTGGRASNVGVIIRQNIIDDVLGSPHLFMENGVDSRIEDNRITRTTGKIDIRSTGGFAPSTVRVSRNGRGSGPRR